MIKVNLINIDSSYSYPDDILSLNVPNFAALSGDIVKLKQQLESFQKYLKIIIIETEGAKDSFNVYLRSLKGSGKKVFVLPTNEPDLISNLKKEFKKLDTLVVCISQTGDDPAAIEAALQFDGYQTIAITNATGALASIAKSKNWLTLEYGDLPSCFASFTNPSLAPAVLFGAPVEMIVNGAQKMFSQCSPSINPSENPSWILASAINRLTLIGKKEMYVRMFSYYLEPFSAYISRLTQEFLLVNKVDIKVLNNTNLNVFNGSEELLMEENKKLFNLFFSIKESRNKDLKNEFGGDISEVELFSKNFSDINKLTLADALNYDIEAAKKFVQSKKISTLSIEMEKIDSYHIGAVFALLQMTVYYLLRIKGVKNEVQSIKNETKRISWQLRTNEKKDN